MKKSLVFLSWILLTILGMVFISCVEEEEPIKVPLRPTNVRATALSSTEITVTWKDNSDNEDGFRVERTTIDSLGFMRPIASVEAGVTTYTDLDLNPTTSYAYRIVAYNSGGNSSPSSITVGTTQSTPTPPNQPLTLRAIPVSNTRVYLSWQDNSNNEDAFRIERGVVGTSSYFGLDTVAENTDNYEDENVIAGTAYQYRVYAYNGIGSSGYTDVVTVTAGANVIPPFAPSYLSASTVSATQISLEWKDNSPNEGGFRVERAPGGTALFTIIANPERGTTRYRDKNLQPGTNYTYRVRAFNNIGLSGFSNTADAITAGLNGAPVGPSSLTAQVKSATQIWLEWTDNSDNEDGFYIERGPGGTTDYSLVATVNANDSVYKMRGLSSSTSYNFRVRAFNTDGQSEYSNVITRATLQIQGVPAAPSLVQVDNVTLSHDKVRFTWTDRSANEDGFHIERAPAGTQDFVQIAIAEVNAKEYTDYEVQQSTRYSYRVRAYNLAGLSNYANTITALTKNSTETRFINGSSHVIVSLVVDGEQYLTAPQEVSVGSFMPIALTAGRHTYAMKNGYWDGFQPVVLYSDTGQFIQQEDVSSSVGFTDPTVYKIITKFKYSAYWEAKYNNGVDSMGYRFFSDGSFFYYNKGVQRQSGVYTLRQYNTNFSVIFKAGEVEGTLLERPDMGYFTMPNGPPGEVVLKYYYQHP
ncbi:MAG: fibronectin type III domain-containing protein [Ignavibacteriae bacterium]|nr:fibronectin type III domain-containing protein [Ignavibacteriota bacterium]